MTKTCVKCNQTLPLDAFNNDKTRSDGKQNCCRECGRAYARTWHQANADKVRGMNIKKRYNMTLEEFNAMLDRQGGLCANPACTESATDIDHDHACCPENGRSCGKCVRGILCNGCNVAEGRLRSNPALMLGLAEYVIMNTKTGTLT